MHAMLVLGGVNVYLHALDEVVRSVCIASGNTTVNIVLKMTGL